MSSPGKIGSVKELENIIGKLEKERKGWKGKTIVVPFRASAP